nr:MAG TPA: hypothetical protein [Caudoviricetes sp.]
MSRLNALESVGALRLGKCRPDGLERGERLKPLLKRLTARGRTERPDGLRGAGRRRTRTGWTVRTGRTKAKKTRR